MDEITLTEAGWASKRTNLHFFAISGSSKFIAYTNIQIYVSGSIFIVIIIYFLKCAQQCPLSHSITIEKGIQTIPLRVVHNVIRRFMMYHYVLQVFHDVLLCLTMFYEV